MLSLLDASWQSLLRMEFSKDYFHALETVVTTAYATNTVYPPEQQLFAAFNACPPRAVKVVILGQDPYHGPGQAHGLSFSVPEGIPVPPSLRNIYKELSSDTNTPLRTSGNLDAWAAQGVLLLNATLTVLPNQPGSHQHIGWETFTDAVIRTLAQEKKHLVFILWGKYASAKATLIDQTKHLILQAPHPSPFSAHRGFFGSRPFSSANRYLQEHRQNPITW